MYIKKKHEKVKKEKRIEDMGWFEFIVVNEKWFNTSCGSAYHESKL